MSSTLPTQWGRAGRRARQVMHACAGQQHHHEGQQIVSARHGDRALLALPTPGVSRCPCPGPCRLRARSGPPGNPWLAAVAATRPLRPGLCGSSGGEAGGARGGAQRLHVLHHLSHGIAQAGHLCAGGRRGGGRQGGEGICRCEQQGAEVAGGALGERALWYGLKRVGSCRNILSTSLSSATCTCGPAGKVRVPSAAPGGESAGCSA